MLFKGREGVEVFMDFWKNAQPLMDTKGIKQADVARITGKTKAAVSDWIKRKCIPKADDALKIADLLGVSVRFLVTGEQDMEPAPLEKKLLDACKNLTEPMLLKVIKEANDLRIMMEQEKKNASDTSASKEA